MKKIFLSVLIGIGMLAAIFQISSGSEAARPAEDYALVCRGGPSFAPFTVSPSGLPFITFIGFTFTRGKKPAGPAGEGLDPGVCSWVDRAMHDDEPNSVSQHKEAAGTPETRWYEELRSPDKYWTFMVSNNGAGQLIATSARPSPRTLGMDEEMKTTSFKPTSEGAKTWWWFDSWANKGAPGFACSHFTAVRDPSSPYFPEVAGQINAGFVHYWNGGSGPFPCQDRNTSEFVGTVWFDLSEIFSKTPLPLAENATLTFKAISSDGPGGVCKDELRLPGDDWMRGVPYNTLPKTGSLEPAKYFEGCPSEGCSVDVTSIVNNWIKGTEDRNGFAISGLDDLAAIGTDDGKNPDNNAHCTTRYGDFTLKVTYRFAIKKPDIPSETYPLVCRGTETLNVHDLDGPVPYRWVGFTFIPGTKKAGEGLLPGQCSWQDRGMRAGEPHQLAQPIEGAVDWIKDLSSSDSYWTFSITTNVYNPREQLQATGAKRNKFVIPLRTNYALAANGGMASASSELDSNRTAVAAINGDRWGLHWGSDPSTGSGWHSATKTYPQWLQVNFNDLKTIDEINVFMVQDNVSSPIEPSLTMPPFTKYGLVGFEVQFLNQFGDWKDVPDGNVSGNDKVWKQFKFPGIRTTRIRVLVNKTTDGDGYSRIVELEAWGK